MKKRIIYKLINFALLAAVAFFIIRFFIINIGQLKSFEFELSFAYLSFSIFCIWMWLLVSSIGIHLITKKVKNTISFVDNLKIWATSYLGLYVPGKIGVIAYRIINYKKHGLSSNQVAYCFFIEMILSIISSGLVILFSALFIQFDYISRFYPLIIILIILLLAMIHPFFIKLYARLYFQYIKKQKFNFEPPHNYFFYLKIIALQFIKWFFAGLGIFMLINSFAYVSIAYFPYITGLYAGASILGMLAIFAPSGIGVIEGVMILGLKEILTNALAGIISVAIRLWKLIGELTFVGFVRIFLYVFK